MGEGGKRSLLSGLPCPVFVSSAAFDGPFGIASNSPRNTVSATGVSVFRALFSYYLALAGGTMPFIRRYSTI